jgi:hypothetical protein
MGALLESVGNRDAEYRYREYQNPENLSSHLYAPLEVSGQHQLVADAPNVARPMVSDRLKFVGHRRVGFG